MADSDRSELWGERNMFSLGNIEPVDIHNGFNQNQDLQIENDTTPQVRNDSLIQIIEAYKDQTKKKNAWSNIAAKFGKDVEFLKAQWKNLKENYKRCLDKRNRMTKSGAGAHSLPTCKYFQNLQLAIKKQK
ncbi:Hypothetical predicted protein, partial [Paramuricea clavata]